ncbi:MAG: hypothetical protein WC291_09415 [Thermodesulfovibrionales bacterium]|jgi:non-specific serine/threonine protein kinase
MSLELHALLMPDGDIQLEWATSEERISKSRQLLEKEIFRRFSEEKASAFLFLGFSEKSVPLSDSLIFWRSFAGLFARKIGLTPDLEQIRQDLYIPLSAEESTAVLDAAPLMRGGEYLSTGLLENIWRGMNSSFAEGIRKYKGLLQNLSNPTARISISLAASIFTW